MYESLRCRSLFLPYHVSHHAFIDYTWQVYLRLSLQLRHLLLRVRRANLRLLPLPLPLPLKVPHCNSRRRQRAVLRRPPRRYQTHYLLNRRRPLHRYVSRTRAPDCANKLLD